MRYEAATDKQLFIYGPGYWKINTKFLDEDQTQGEFFGLILREKEKGSYRSNFKNWWFENFKYRAKHFYKNKAISFNLSIKKEKEFLNTKLVQNFQKLRSDNDPAILQHIDFCKTRIKEIELARLEALGNKCKIKSLASEEKINTFHLVKAFKIKEKNQMLSLTNNKTNRDKFTNYFRNLFEVTGELNPLNIVDLPCKTLTNESAD